MNGAVRTIVTTLRQEDIRFAPPIDLAMVVDPTAPSSDDEADDTDPS